MHPDSHQESNGQRADDRIGTPWAVAHGLYNGQGESRKGKDENKKDGKTGHGTGKFPDFRLGDQRNAPALMAHRGEKNHHIMHGARNHGADDDPEGAGQIAELGSQNGAEQGTRCRDCGKMVTEVTYLLVG